MAATAIFALRVNVRNLDRAEQFYHSQGMIEDIGMRLVVDPGRPHTVIAGTEGRALRSVALRWPYDPYMHLVLAESPDSPGPVSPVDPEQTGPTTFTLLVSDLDGELAGVSARGGRVVRPPAETQRLLGKSRAALVTDPDGNPVELISLEHEPGWDNSGCRVAPSDRTFLHVELNTENFREVSAFYGGFGFEHNPLNNLREGWARLPDDDPEDPYVKAFGRSIVGHLAGLNFARLPTDHSQMHLEIMGWKPGNLIDPVRPQTFHQRGIMRMCFKTTDVDGALDDIRRRGLPVLQERQRCGLGWGDTEWLFFHDPDGNIATFEEWFPAGHWGERC